MYDDYDYDDDDEYQYEENLPVLDTVINKKKRKRSRQRKTKNSKASKPSFSQYDEVISSYDANYDPDFEFNDYHNYNEPFLGFSDYSQAVAKKSDLPASKPSAFSLRNAILIGLATTLFLRRAHTFDRKNLFLSLLATYMYNDFHRPFLSIQNSVIVAGGIYGFNKVDETVAVGVGVFKLLKDYFEDIFRTYLN